MERTLHGSVRSMELSFHGKFHEVTSMVKVPLGNFHGVSYHHGNLHGISSMK